MRVPMPSQTTSTVEIKEQESPSNLVTHKLKKDGGGGHENAALAVITRSQAYTQPPITKESESSESEGALDLPGLDGAAKEAARIAKEATIAVNGGDSTEGSDQEEEYGMCDWEGPGIPKEEFGILGHEGLISGQKYDLWRDLRRMKADISLAQLLEISPVMKKNFKEG